MRRVEEFAGVGRVSDRRGVADGEHGSDVQRVAVGDDSFLELAVDAQPFDARRESAQCGGGAAGRRPRALQKLMIRCGFAVLGQRVRRWLSQSTRTWWVRSSSGRSRPAMVMRRFPRSTSPSCIARIWPGRAAWMAASATNSSPVSASSHSAARIALGDDR